MILGFTTTFFVYLFLAACFYLVRDYSLRFAISGLVFANLFLIFAARPSVFFLLVAQLVLVLAIYLFCSRLKRLPTIANFIPLLTLIPLNLGMFGDSLSLLGLAELGVSEIPLTFGASFFILKSYVLLKEALRDGSFSLAPSLAALTFVPSFGSGPIHGSKPWAFMSLRESPRLKDCSKVFFKMGWGAASLYVIAPWLEHISKSYHHNIMSFGIVYLEFAALYFAFSGYSILAIAFAELFGVKLPKNFERPYVATSVQEFWQRWHISLSAFISTYIYQPLVRKTGHKYGSIIASFSLVGLWHDLSLGYFLWGLGHGIALCFCSANIPVLYTIRQFLGSVVYKFLCWVLTISWVSWLSHIARMNI